jgi:hypothetical protein
MKRRSRRVTRAKAARSNSELLHTGLEPARKQLYAAYGRLWTRPAVGAIVLDFLVLMHQIVRASVPLMNVAHARATKLGRTDRVSRLFARYLTKHIAEERHHDEWLVQDLETAGICRTDVTQRVPSRAAASLVGAQYYWVQHHDPVGLLGYMRVLEGNPPSEAHINNLQRQSRLPASVFRTYRLHGELDPNHRRELDLFIDSLPLTESQTCLILESASHTASTLAVCIDALEPRVTAGKRSTDGRL